MQRVSIREFTPSDYQAVADIQNVLIPDTPAVIEDYAEVDRRRPDHCRHRRWVAEVGNQVVGLGQYDQYVWAYHPQKFNLLVRVRPEFWRQGIGSALYDQVLADLEPHQPQVLQTRAREDHPEGIRFLTGRGFAELEREGQSRLDVTTFDAAPYAGLDEAMQHLGVEIKNINELAADPERDRKLYELDWTLVQDMPTAEKPTRVEFDTWVKDVLHSPTCLPEGYLVAVHGDDYIAMSTLWADRASDALYQGLTATRREWRRKGIATALKVRGIEFAGATGHSPIVTGNNVENRPMLSINERLNFVRQPDWITFQKVLS